MSSTKRGGVREASDYYVTPAWMIDEFLWNFEAAEPKLFEKLTSGEFTVLDPCSGGRITDDKDGMPYPEALRRFGVPSSSIATCDIREDSLAAVKCNYLETPLRRIMIDEPGPGLIISNPPFSHALEFIEKGLSEVRPQGWVIMLCRLNFFGSKKRLPFWKAGNMPRYTFVHSRRPSFGAAATTERAKTDSIEYAHLCWSAKDLVEGRFYTELFVLGKEKENTE
jgi:hypothetical protein